MNINPKANEAQYGVVRGVAEPAQLRGQGIRTQFKMNPAVIKSLKKKLHPQKRFFADNLHHKSHIAIFGQNLKTAADNNVKGDHLFFDPNYKSEYRQNYDELAKASLDKYLREGNKIEPLRQNVQYVPKITENPQYMGAQQQAQMLGQDNFFQGEEHEQFNSHQKRQMHLKGQWRLEDMDPEGSIVRDIQMRQQQIMNQEMPLDTNEQQHYDGYQMEGEQPQRDIQQQVDAYQQAQMHQNQQEQLQEQQYDQPAIPEPAVPPLQPQRNMQPAMDQKIQEEPHISIQQQNQMEVPLQQSSYGYNQADPLIRSSQKPTGKRIFTTEDGNIVSRSPLRADPMVNQAQDMAADQQPKRIASIGNLYDGIPQEYLAEPQNDSSAVGSLNRPNQRYSLEQTRFQNRIKNASRRQNEMYKLQCGREKAVEKVKYAKLLEQRELINIGANTNVYSHENVNHRQPLGKVVTQVEMNNAEARSQLREMLEFQIQEKQRFRDENTTKREREQLQRPDLIMKDRQLLLQELQLQKDLQNQMMRQKEQDKVLQQQQLDQIKLEMQSQNQALVAQEQNIQNQIQQEQANAQYTNQLQMHNIQPAAGQNAQKVKGSHNRYDEFYKFQAQKHYASQQQLPAASGLEGGQDPSSTVKHLLNPSQSGHDINLDYKGQPQYAKTLLPPRVPVQNVAQSHKLLPPLAPNAGRAGTRNLNLPQIRNYNPAGGQYYSQTPNMIGSSKIDFKPETMMPGSGRQHFQPAASNLEQRRPGSVQFVTNQLPPLVSRSAQHLPRLGQPKPGSRRGSLKPNENKAMMV